MNVLVVPSVPEPRVLLTRTLCFATWVANQALAAKAWSGVTVVLTDDRGIAQLNERFLKHKGPTDVISFRLDPVPGERGASGEVYVNTQRALQRATRRWPASKELALYIAHGIDHLGGASDHTPRLRARMRRRELRWLKKAGRHAQVSLRLM
ncbi:MAG: rRNA maturation RNase YbeY [bacterium]